MLKSNMGKPQAALVLLKVIFYFLALPKGLLGIVFFFCFLKQIQAAVSNRGISLERSETSGSKTCLCGRSVFFLFGKGLLATSFCFLGDFC